MIRRKFVYAGKAGFSGLLLSIALLGGCVSTASGPQMRPEFYGTLSCEGLAGEYQTQSNAILALGTPAGLPVAVVGSGAPAPKDLERTILTAEALHKIGHLREEYVQKACGKPLVDSVPVETAKNVERAMGASLYASSCVSCHGSAGRGDGWLSRHLSTRPSDLTQIKARNGGTFPEERMEAVIDGRRDIALHGPREMPVWGSTFQSRAAKAYAGPFVPESGIGRTPLEGEISFLDVRALVRYLASLQQ